MLYRPFGFLGWPVSAIGMGAWNIGGQWGHHTDAEAFATIRAAFESGITLFDAAESYGVPHGRSEELLGVGLTGIRQRVTLVTKIGNWGKRQGDPVPKTSVDLIRLCAHACLYRLRTDWIDVLLCHEGNVEDPRVYLETFKLLQEQGLIRAYGISTDDLEVLKRFNADGGCRVVQLRYSLLDRRAEQDLLPYCQEHGIAVMIRGPLEQGLLSGNYYAGSVFPEDDTVRAKWNPEGAQRQAYLERVRKVDALRGALGADTDLVQTALRFTFSHPARPCAIPGARSPEQARANAAAGARELTPDERARCLNSIPD
jgi:myo-inositol catabolism protein IolS